MMADSILTRRSPRLKAPRVERRVQTSVSFSPPVAVALRRVAKKEDRSLSSIVTEAVRYYLDIHYPTWEEWVSSEEQWKRQVLRS